MTFHVNENSNSTEINDYFNSWTTEKSTQLPGYIEKVSRKEFLITYEPSDVDLDYMDAMDFLTEEETDEYELTDELYERYESELLPTRIVHLLSDEGVTPTHTTYSLSVVNDKLLEQGVLVYKIVFD